LLYSPLVGAPIACEVECHPPPPAGHEANPREHSRDNLEARRRQLSFEDMDSLLNNLLIFNAFIFAFAASLVTGTWSHDEILQADARASAILVDLTQFYPGTGYRLISVDFLTRGYLAMIFMFCSMMICLIASVSLNFSSAREQPATLLRWARFGRPVIAFAYLLFFIGLTSYFQAHLSVEMSYPRYTVPPKGQGFFDPFFTVWRNGGVWSDYYDSNTGTMITSTTTFYNSSSWSADNIYGLSWQVSSRLQIVNSIITWITFVCGVGFAVWFNIYDAKKTALRTGTKLHPCTGVRPSPRPSSRSSTAPASETSTCLPPCPFWSPVPSSSASKG